jgi:hypothetical protein
MIFAPVVVRFALVFPLLPVEAVLERPAAVKGAPLSGAAKRTLDGEDRSERMGPEGEDREKLAGE